MIRTREVLLYFSIKPFSFLARHPVKQILTARTPFILTSEGMTTKRHNHEGRGCKRFTRMKGGAWRTMVESPISRSSSFLGKWRSHLYFHHLISFVPYLISFTPLIFNNASFDYESTCIQFQCILMQTNTKWACNIEKMWVCEAQPHIIQVGGCALVHKVQRWPMLANGHILTLDYQIVKIKIN